MTQTRLGYGLALSLLVLAGMVACQPADGAPAEEAVDQSAARVVNVRVMEARPGDFVDYIRATGEVEALNDVTLSAEEGGVVREFYVQKGATVREGQAIARIDDAVLKAQVDEARAAAQLARERFERLERLWQTDKIGSEIGYLQAKSEAEAAAARAAALEARLARTVIRSPVTGVFDEKNIEEGEMAMPGARVGRVVAARELKITAGIPERFALDVETGAAARVTFDIFPGREFTGQVGFVGSTVDADNRTFPVEIRLSNPQRLIKPRMVANVQVVRARLKDALVVPQDLVLRTEAGYQVFVVAERDGRQVAEARPVKLGAAYENRVVITEGLNPGDRLVMSGQRLVDHGSRVRVVNEAEEVRP